MKKLDNKEVAKTMTVSATQSCHPSSNCNACMPSGCSCSKCFDSQAKGNEAVKEVYKGE